MYNNTTNQPQQDDDQQQLYPGSNFEPQFRVGQRVLAYRDGYYQPGEVEAVEPDKHNTGVFYFYVHFADSDRRLDIWAEADALRAAPAQPRKKQPPHFTTTVRLRRHVTQSLNNDASAAAATSTSRAGTRAGAGSGSRARGVQDSTTTSSSHLTNVVQQAQADVISAAPVNNSGKHGQLGNVHRNADSKFFDRPKNVAKFYIGEYEVDGWYFSPYLLAHHEVRRKLREATRNSVWSSIPGDANVSIGNKSNTNNSTSGGGGGNKAAAEQQQQQQRLLLEKQRAADAQLSAATRDFCLHLCPYCLEPELEHRSLLAHLGCCWKRPPGREIYRDPARKIIVFECDGAVHPAFGQNLALISKSFLEHKTVDCDTTPFVFYPVCSITDAGCEVCGYFSREKRNQNGYNLSCILTLPQFQARGLGRFMIDLSYEMSRRCGVCGTPEKPLSDFGERMYHSAWRDRVLDAIAAHTCMEHQTISLDQLMRVTGMIRTDVTVALGQLKILDTKALPTIRIVVEPEMLRKHMVSRIKRQKQHVNFEPALLHWFPEWYKLRALSSLKMSGNQVTVVPTEEVLDAAEEAAKAEDGRMKLNIGGDMKVGAVPASGSSNKDATKKKSSKQRRQRDD